MPQIEFFGLSTCVHCKRAKEYLDKCGQKYNCTYVDMLAGEERTKAIAEVKKHNPSMSFPTIVIGDKVVVGFNEQELAEALKEP